MCDEIDDKYSVFSLLHEPLNPPRDGHIGEHIYAQEWKKEMRPGAYETDPEATAFARVMAHFPGPLSQRYATVVASIVTWFGTNLGISFLETAKQFGEIGGFLREQRYALAWAIQNQRRMHINSGTRTIENCLRAYGHISLPGTMACWSHIPELSADDYEAAECLMHWLGSTSAGSNFIARAERLIMAERNREAAERNSSWRRQIDNTASLHQKGGAA